jgi:D-amino-acid oxidase
LPPGFAAGWRYRVPLIDMPVYLDYLLRRLTAAGGTLRIQRHDRMPSGPIVVNCTGSGARSLVPDVDVTTVRGQLVVMENPGITEFFCAVDDDETTELLYYMPHGERIVVGGVAQPGRWDRSPDPQSAHGILERCLRIQPRLARARIIGQTAGLRPIRPSVRLEKDGRVIHNYGHGGGGVTLSWGCAAVVADLVRQF